MSKVKEKRVVLEMLELYRNMPYLWDKLHHKYMDKEVRMEGLRVLVEVLKKLDPGATIKTVNKKLQNLRTNFCREHKKDLSSLSSDADVESEHQRTPIQSSLTKRKKKILEKNQDKLMNVAEELLKRKEEEWEVLGKSIGLQLRDLDKNQSNIAQKLISDVIYYSKNGLLNHSSFIDIGSKETAMPSSSNKQPPTKRPSLHNKYHTTSESQSPRPSLNPSPYHPSGSPQYDQLLSPQAPFTDTYPDVSHGKSKQNTSVPSTSHRNRVMYPHYENQADSSDLPPQNHSSFIDIGSKETAMPSSSNKQPPTKRSSLHNKYHTTSESQSPRPSLNPFPYHPSGSPQYDQMLSPQAPFTDTYPDVSHAKSKQNTSVPSTSHRNRVLYPQYENQADSSDLPPHYQVPPLQHQIQTESANPYPHYQLLPPYQTMSSSNSHIQTNSSMPLVYYQNKTIDQAPPSNTQVHAYSVVSIPDYQILQYPLSLPPHQQKLTAISVPSSPHQICSQAPSLDHNIQTLYPNTSYSHNQIQEYSTTSSSHNHTSSGAQSPDMADQSL